MRAIWHNKAAEVRCWSWKLAAWCSVVAASSRQLRSLRTGRRVPPVGPGGGVRSMKADGAEVASLSDLTLGTEGTAGRPCRKPWAISKGNQTQLTEAFLSGAGDTSHTE